MSFEQDTAKFGKAVYVSSSAGRNVNDGLTPDTPVASIGRAVQLVQAGLADRMLLRRGDVFAEPIGRWTRSGQSEAQAAVIGAYGPGSDRPVVRTRGAALELCAGDGPLRDVRIEGICFCAAGRDADEPGYDVAVPPSAGICVRGRAERIRFEDCRVEGYERNVLLLAADDVSLQRCILVDAAASRSAPTAPAINLMAVSCRGLTVERCVFDWTAPHRGTRRRTPPARCDVHLVAIECVGLTVTGCVLSRSTGAAILVANSGHDAAASASVSCNVLIANRAAVLTAGASTVRASGNRRVRIPPRPVRSASIPAGANLLRSDPCLFIANARAQSGLHGWLESLSPETLLAGGRTGFAIKWIEARSAKSKPAR